MSLPGGIRHILDRPSSASGMEVLCGAPRSDWRTAIYYDAVSVCDDGGICIGCKMEYDRRVGLQKEAGVSLSRLAMET